MREELLQVETCGGEAPATAWTRPTGPQPWLVHEPPGPSLASPGREAQQADARWTVSTVLSTPGRGPRASLAGRCSPCPGLPTNPLPEDPGRRRVSEPLCKTGCAQGHTRRPFTRPTAVLLSTYCVPGPKQGQDSLPVPGKGPLPSLSPAALPGVWPSGPCGPASAAIGSCLFCPTDPMTQEGSQRPGPPPGRPQRDGRTAPAQQKCRCVQPFTCPAPGALESSVQRELRRKRRGSAEQPAWQGGGSRTSCPSVCLLSSLPPGSAVQGRPQMAGQE